MGLSRERVLRTAVKIADERGIGSLTMRRLADELGAEAMSLYYHVANKEGILDGVVDVVASEINDAVGTVDAPSGNADWKKVVRQRILTARQVFLRHPWAPHVFATRTNTSPAVLRYHDGLVGILHGAGFSYDLIHHALHALGSRALGFTQELFDPGNGTPGDGTLGNGTPGDEPDPAMAAMAGQLPNLASMLAVVAHDDPDSTLGWCDDQFEFEFGLDLILDGLDRLREAGE